MSLSANDFAPFFQEVHGHAPFPWQERLMHQIAEERRWPKILDLPTGAGKTAALDVALFHLALEADRNSDRRAPVRIAFVVDRRLVVDDAFERARRIERALLVPKGLITTEVAERLRALSGDDDADAVPLLARRLRGGIPRESDWARTPSQPTVLCSTVDQIGSRLLFRGYGVSNAMRPLHAGLIGSDCLVLLDEAHLAEPFRQTLGWIERYQRENWSEETLSAPWGFALLTATPGEPVDKSFHLDARDREDPILSRRLRASKPVRLVKSGKSSSDGGAEASGTTFKDDVGQRACALLAELRAAREHFADPNNGAVAPAIAIVVNRVARARAVHAALGRELREEIFAGLLDEPVLMIGAARPIDRDKLAGALQPIRTTTWREGERRRLPRTLIIVATQCIEAGVDIDLDALVTEAASLDALKQRFGRLNRAGREVQTFGSVVTMSADLATRYVDAVYDQAIRPAWDYLSRFAEKKRGGPPIVDLGLNAFSACEQQQPVPTEAMSRKSDAPVLLPAHVDLLTQTSPVPAADPDIALYLHGPDRQPDSVSIIWRGDVDGDDVAVRRLLTIAPPRASEALELPVWVVRRWLLGRRTDDLSDVPSAEVEGGERVTGRDEAPRVFLWRGDDEASRWVDADEVKPGSTIVVPADQGGLDRFGWNPDSSGAVVDAGREAGLPFRARRFAVRVAPGLLGSKLRSTVASLVAERREETWSELRDGLLQLPLDETLRDDLQALDKARRCRVIPYTDLYGVDEIGRPRGVVFLAPLGIEGQSEDVRDLQASATEDDVAGSLPGYDLSLAVHSQDVERQAETFARAAGLPENLVVDLRLAGYLHDTGKRDRRFQAWLQYGDPFGVDPEIALAKSRRRLPRRARIASGLPDRWRHEAFSVRLARASERLAEARDPMLVLWLVGTHHGFGRPFFPHQDPSEPPDDLGPQSLAFDWRGHDWPSIFDRLKQRYGIWGLARLEAILRLADHRASEFRAKGEAP